MWKKYLSVGVILVVLTVVGLMVGLNSKQVELPQFQARLSDVELIIPWSGLGASLVESGVISEEKFRRIYPNRQAQVDAILSSDASEVLVMRAENADIWLNALWAFGLANKNPVLEEGPMMDPRYGGPGGFASTGGWTLGREDAMAYYSQLPLTILTQAQQDLLEKVSKSVYRPCCSNSTYFPDCNHGMAMLGLLELLVEAGASETELYEAAKIANTFWFGPAVGGSC